MERMTRRKLLGLLIVVIALNSWASKPKSVKAAPSERDRGLIDGIVTYEDRRPVKGATVYAQPMGRPMFGITPHADTDETGYFAIHISPSWFGKFAVGAEKLDEGYLNLTNQFYSDGKFETVTLTTRHRNATVIIRLGPKAGVLLGTVTDAVTRAPLKPCVEFRRAENPNNFLSANGLVKPRYRLLVPANTGILMKISLDGYKPWYYPGTVDKSAGQPFSLKPAEERNVDIQLQPDKGATENGCPKPIGVAANSW
jgi:hypothetical protein